MIVSTRTARLTPLSIVRAGCRRILVDDSHNTLVWGMAVDTVFEGKRKISPTTRTRTVLIPDIMMLELEAALKPAR